MIYTEETKKKLDVILRAFAAYINSQNYFDILYSKKAGYIYLVIRFIELGLMIASLRKMQGMSQEKLAEKAKISRSHYDDFVREHPYDAAQLDEMVELMVETVCSRKKNIRVADSFPSLPAVVP